MERRQFLKTIPGIINFSSLSFGHDMKSSLEKFVHRDYTPEEEYAELNNQNIVNVLQNNEKVCTLIRNGSIFRNNIKNILNEKEHEIYRDMEGVAFDRGIDEIDFMNNRQLIRIFLILEDLNSNETQYEIWKQIKSDLEDKFSEHGGIVKLDDEGKILYEAKNSCHMSLTPFLSLFGEAGFKVLEDIGVDRNKILNDDNETYKLSLMDYLTPNIAEYHFHAVDEDNTLYAGPSCCISVSESWKNAGDKDFFKKRSHVYGDIGWCTDRIATQGESHNLVFTKLVGKRFNVGYFGGEFDEKEEMIINVLSLGNYEYEKF